MDGFERLLMALARVVTDLHDPYELAECGMDDGERYAETLRLLETEPEAIAEWLEGR